MNKGEERERAEIFLYYIYIIYLLDTRICVCGIKFLLYTYTQRRGTKKGEVQMSM